MTLSSLLSLLQDIPAYRALIAGLDAEPPCLPAEGVPLGLLTAARPAVVAALHAHTRQPMLVLVARADNAQAFVQQVRIWSPFPQAVFRLPDPDALPYERVAWGRDTIGERIRVLAAMAAWQGDDSHGHPPLVVASARALMQKTIPPVTLRPELRSLRVGQRVVLNDLLKAWLDTGYRHSSTVEEPGTFSRRGGILDIFPPNQPLPLRVELFGDEIDSLRTFDPLTQRSERRVTAFDFVPAHEALTRLSPAAAEAARQLDLSACHPVARSDFEEDIRHLGQSEHFRGIEFYLPFFYDHPASPIEYLPVNGLLVIEDPAELTGVMGDLEQQARHLERDLRHHGELPTDWPPPYFAPEELTAQMHGRPHLIAGHSRWVDEATPPVAPQPDSQPSLADLFAPAPVYGGQLKRLVDDLGERRRAGDRIVLVSRQAARLADLLAERDIPYQLSPAVSTGEEAPESAPGSDQVQDTLLPQPASITMVPGATAISGGWILDPAGGDVSAGGHVRCMLLTDAEIFGYHKPPPRHRAAAARQSPTPESLFADVQPGDCVVHIEHGIGVFHGLVKLNMEGAEHEYLQIDYAGSDRLYVPIHQADRLSRYVGADDRPPQIHRLGGAGWDLVKRRAKRAVEEIAAGLLEIYAAREVSPGHAFLADSPWQHELEAAFPYIETEDQLRAIDQVKADMEKAKPMDRLICGDVGYGKTEVALRAAFKAVTGGKQVAVLVPTTVLAQQHYQTFTERLKPYPVNVEMLSRFRSRKEQREILATMAKGTADIVIGTHRLLQKDVRFKSLGLLVIDEEQRFGVSHKERLKKMRTEVDVLTLTATPIPRTLHMSLTGVRDMSTIDTPPAERLSIKTTVSQYDETLMRTAILRELGRGGQVYFVHNRVVGIEQLADRVAQLVPEATLAIAHGQMPESQLERVMMGFMRGDTDVLVCTSIIESGLDIPNANTIIINRADRFGLAQLYQLRGRVGRGAVRAYAYLFIPRKWEPGEPARKRLQAIAEASDLGAGFRIAMRDLEIRGAGDLLGARQHGHIAAVGFDLYARLLARAVRQLKDQSGQTVPGDDSMPYLAPLAEGIQINLPLPVYLPQDYVPDSTLRLQLYRRLAGLMAGDEVTAMGQELEDRFGALPEPVLNLLYQLRLKVLALESGVQSISVEAGQILIKADGLEDLNRAALQRHVGDQARVGRRQIWMPLHPNTAVWQAELEKVLRRMHGMVHDPGR